MLRRAACLLVLLSVAAICWPAISHAQQGVSATARTGHCVVRLSGRLPAASPVVVEREGRVVRDEILRQVDLPRAVSVGQPLGINTKLRITVGGSPLAVSLAPADGSDDGCDQDAVDDEEVFEANGYVGLSIDTFAAAELHRYLNPNDSGNARFHSTAGVNFAYRALRRRGVSLWIVGETLHNAKSTSVDCDANPELDTCKELTTVIPADPGGRFLAILRNASSAEASMAVRLHLFEVNRHSESPAAFYVQAKLGFLTVAKSDGDAAEFRTYSLGFMALNGPLAGSYLDVGWGRSDVYPLAPKGRLKVDGLFSIELLGQSTVRPYLQMVVDADRGNGADSIQTFVGIDINLASIIGGR